MCEVTEKVELDLAGGAGIKGGTDRRTEYGQENDVAKVRKRTCPTRGRHCSPIVARPHQSLARPGLNSTNLQGRQGLCPGKEQLPYPP